MTLLRWLTHYPQSLILIGLGYLALAWAIRKEFQRAKDAGEEWE